MRHQAHPCSLLSHHLSVPALCSLSCIVPAGSQVKSQEGDQSSSSCGVSLWTGGLCSKNPYSMASSSVWAEHCIASGPSPSITSMEEAATGERRFERCGTGTLALLTWTRYTQWGQDVTHSYSDLPCISECKRIAGVRLCKQPISK